MSRPLLLGHRGARAVRSIPENTIASFDRAVEDGCDGFEFDVQLTRDGDAVICHDPVTNGVEIARASSGQLSKLPRLEEVLVRYQSKAFLDIEFKVPGIERVATELLGKYPPARGYVVSSFLPGVLEATYAAAAGTPLGLICESRTQLLRWKELKIGYLMLHRKFVTPELVEELKSAKKKIFVWTANAPDEMRRFAKLAIDGIISDKTELLRRTIRGM